jgi:tRNA (guanine-N7-)-methyltransferase
MHRILKTKGTVTFVTDDMAYSDWTIHHFGQHTGYQSTYPAPFYQHEMPGYGSSYFEDLWRQKGKAIRYHQFTKKPASE